jgi:probable DNA metabolism protein
MTLFLNEEFPVQVPLSGPVDVTGFHAEASRLLARLIPPETVEWSVPPQAKVDERERGEARATIQNRAVRAIVPQSFVRLSELVVLHRDPQRFDLLYRSLWRLMYEPGLKHDSADVDMAKLRQMAQSVRRDVRKMKTHLAFRPLQLKGRTVQVSWYEPVHFVTELVAQGLAARQPGAPWLLLSPDRSLWWDGARLLSAPGLRREQQPQSFSDETAWTKMLEVLPWL